MGAISDLIELFANGGITVETPDPEDGSAIAARSVIQPDGDFTMKLAQSALARPDLRQTHLDEVQSRMKALSLLRVALNYYWWVLMAPVLVYGIRELLQAIFVNALISLLVIILLPLSKYIVTYVARWFIQRKIKELVGPLDVSQTPA